MMLILKFVVILFQVAFINAFSITGSEELLYIAQTSPQKAFDKFMKGFNKSYIRGSLEYSQRFSHFQATINRINSIRPFSLDTTLQESNAAVYGINKFSDLSPSEFKEKYLTAIAIDDKIVNSVEMSIWEKNISHYPKSFDWRDKGIVTPVHNQGQCGSCWAFSVVETIESMWAKSGHGLVPLSAQQLIDCSNNYGCKGGNPCGTLAWVKKSNVTIVKNSAYPYKERQESCHSESLSSFGVGVSEYFCHKCWKSCTAVEMNEMLPTLLNIGPISVSVDAISWQDYVSGIIQHHCSSGHPDHAVQVVGYNLGGVPHWIVRNSWGSDFGDGGYLYIKIGENLCGIANSYCGVSSVKGFHKPSDQT